jgi:hypothetical protein
MLPTINPIQTIPATEKTSSTNGLSQKRWGLGYLQKCRWTFWQDFDGLDRFLLYPSASQLTPSTIVILIVVVLDFLEQAEGLGPRVYTANRPVLALIAGGRGTFTIGRNRSSSRENLGAHFFQVGFHRIE